METFKPVTIGVVSPDGKFTPVKGDDRQPLPPEVTDAIKQTEVTVEMFDTLVTMNREHWDALVAHLHRLAEENARLRFDLRDQQLLAKANAEHAIQRLTRAEKAEARVQELERENEILAIKNRGTLANNLCPDHRDKQTGKPCLACAIETLTREKDRAEAELAAIKKRIAGSAHARSTRNGIIRTPNGWVAPNAEFALLPLDDEAKS